MSNSAISQENPEVPKKSPRRLIEKLPLEKSDRNLLVKLSTFRPNGPKAASLYDLIVDEYITRSDLISLLCTGHQMYSITLPLQWRVIDLYLTNDTEKGGRGRQVQFERLGYAQEKAITHKIPISSYIKHIHVHDEIPESTSHISNTSWASLNECLVKLLVTATNLVVFKWNSTVPFSESILDALASLGPSLEIAQFRLDSDGFLLYKLKPDFKARPVIEGGPKRISPVLAAKIPGIELLSPVGSKSLYKDCKVDLTLTNATSATCNTLKETITRYFKHVRSLTIFGPEPKLDQHNETVEDNLSGSLTTSKRPLQGDLQVESLKFVFSSSFASVITQSLNSSALITIEMEQSQSIRAILDPLVHRTKNLKTLRSIQRPLPPKDTTPEVAYKAKVDDMYSFLVFLRSRSCNLQDLEVHMDFHSAGFSGTFFAAVSAHLPTLRRLVAIDIFSEFTGPQMQQIGQNSRHLRDLRITVPSKGNNRPDALLPNLPQILRTFSTLQAIAFILPTTADKQRFRDFRILDACMTAARSTPLRLVTVVIEDDHKDHFFLRRLATTAFGNEGPEERDAAAAGLPSTLTPTPTPRSRKGSRVKLVSTQYASGWTYYRFMERWDREIELMALPGTKKLKRGAKRKVGELS